MSEARLERNEAGLAPAEDGWFVVNVRDAQWLTGGSFGSVGVFQSRELEWQQLGVNIRVLHPGQPNCLYHRENLQEAYLVLYGECTLLVDEQERPLRQWDFVHLPPDTSHVAVGAGDGPCAILMIGARDFANEKLFYPKSEVAERHGASAAADTPDPDVAYATSSPPSPGRPPGWDALPWA